MISPARRAAKARYRASEKGRATERAYAARTRERRRELERMRRERPDVKAKKSALFAKWQAEHRAERSAYERRRLAAKPQLARAARLRRREERAAEYRAWCLANPDRARFLNARRRARQAAAPGSHTWQEWAEKKQLFAYCCAYCGEAGPLTVDHKVPLSRGGSDSIDNILPACFTCNARKHDKTTAEYLALKEAA